METKDVLNEFLKELLDGIREPGAFVKDQLPLVLQEYVTWGIVSGVLQFLLCIAGAFVLFALIKKWSYPAAMKADSDAGEDMGYWMANICLFGGGVALSILAVGHALTAVKAAVAPRVYLLEELSKLL